MDTLMTAAAWLPSLPAAQWATALRQMPIRDPQPNELVITAQAREVAALSSGHRRMLAVALAEMPDLSMLGMKQGECHVRLVVQDNTTASYAHRMTGANRERRIAALERQIEVEQQRIEATQNRIRLKQNELRHLRGE